MPIKGVDMSIPPDIWQLATHYLHCVGDGHTYLDRSDAEITRRPAISTPLVDRVVAVGMVFRAVAKGAFQFTQPRLVLPGAGFTGTLDIMGKGDRLADVDISHRRKEANAISSGLPVPPGGGVPRPSGIPGNLVVLNWAGFGSALTYTFDDGQPSHIAHYGELQATGVHMTFYVSSNVNWVPNSDAVWAQAVRDGHEIGNHTVSHPYANLTGSCFGRSPGSQEAEVGECTKYIIQHFGQPDVWTMASPYGDVGWKNVAKSSFFLNRGVGGGTIGPNDNSDPFNLPCYMANSGENAARFNGLIDSAHSAGRWLILLYHTISPTNDNWYAPVDIAEIVKSIDHAKSLGNVWIDTVSAIGAYWVGQKLLASATPTTSGTDTTWTWTLPAHFPKGKYLRVKVDGGTLKQGDRVLQWDTHGYYEVALDEGSLTLTP